ncbi:MAG: hypothetical protein PWQ97_344 [Tepidanaerobacteraceae bacterium]|nr:hypothetical protein [Tepidanaerobacteraceae bacterium]
MIKKYFFEDKVVREKIEKAKRDVKNFSHHKARLTQINSIALAVLLLFMESKPVPPLANCKGFIIYCIKKNKKMGR